MTHISKLMIAAAVLALWGNHQMAAMAEQKPQIVEVWPGIAPGESTSNTGTVEHATDNIVRITDVTRPQLQIFGAEKGSGRPAVLVCPGGGYGILAYDLEGTEVAHWLNRQNFVAAVLSYRVPGKRDAAYADAQRAISLLRAHSSDYGIDPNRVGVLGFSAGGHLSARLSTGYAERSYAAIDKADAQPIRPDFTVLVYPAYLIDKSTGKPAPEVTPHAGMPPCFLIQTQDDPYMDVQDYSKSLNEANVETNCVVFPTGGHGYGLRAKTDQPVSSWKELAEAWLKIHTGRHPIAAIKSVSGKIAQ